MMDDKPFGKFIISSGIGMTGVIAFVLFGSKRLELHIGITYTAYLFFVLLAILVIAVGVFNDRFKSNVTVPIGTVGWLVVFVMLFIHYTRQHY